MFVCCIIFHAIVNVLQYLYLNIYGILDVCNSNSSTSSINKPAGGMHTHSHRHRSMCKWMRWKEKSLILYISSASKQYIIKISILWNIVFTAIVLLSSVSFFFLFAIFLSLSLSLRFDSITSSHRRRFTRNCHIFLWLMVTVHMIKSDRVCAFIVSGNARVAMKF